jgi:hypothetical protein
MEKDPLQSISLGSDSFLESAVFCSFRQVWVNKGPSSRAWCCLLRLPGLLSGGPNSKYLATGVARPWPIRTDPVKAGSGRPPAGQALTF